MFDNLDELEKKYEELTEKISDPAVISNQTEWSKMMKERSDLEPIVEKYKEYKKVKQNFEDPKELMSDPEMKELAQEELMTAKRDMERLKQELQSSAYFPAENSHRGADRATDAGISWYAGRCVPSSLPNGSGSGSGSRVS